MNHYLENPRAQEQQEIPENQVLDRQDYLLEKVEPSTSQKWELQVKINIGQVKVPT